VKPKGVRRETIERQLAELNIKVEFIGADIDERNLVLIAQDAMPLARIHAKAEP
jgi:hypothetical protein